jgi:hypothetical protein
MSYLLLLALVLVAGFIFGQLSLPENKRSPSQTFLLIALILLGAGLFSELVLGFALNETAAKVFFWTRGTLVLAWFGQSFLLALIPNDRRIRWLSIGILVASLGLLVIVFLLHITPAVDWYSTAKPIYSQIGDLLATNRPSRWGALAMNLYGVTILLGGSIFLYIRLGANGKWFPFFLVAFGAIGLFSPLYWPPFYEGVPFYDAELLTPIALYIGMRNLTGNIRTKREDSQ